MSGQLTALTAAAVTAAAGLLMILLAGAREARGELSPARRLVRLGGWLAVPGSFGTAVLFHTAASGPIAIAGAVLVSGAGFAGLLAALSGKPRPSGHFAAALFLAGLLCLLATA
jgi:hypothetical protein